MESSAQTQKPIQSTPPALSAPSMEPVPQSSGSKLPVMLVIVVLGIVVLGGLGAWFWMRSNRVAESPVETPLAEVLPTINPTPQVAVLSLTITSPTEDTLFTSASTTVTGKTAPNTDVTVVSEGDEVIVESDASGNFSAPIKLVSGINTIVITAFGENDQEKSLTMDIVYDTE